MNTAQDWGYKNEPQDGACRGYKTKRCAWPRGKTLGGSSSINAMFYVRGNKIDYDEWAASGNEGWSYDEVLPYFKKSEHYMGYTTDDTEPYHGKEGILNVENYPDMHFFEDLIIRAAGELGLKNSTDINGASQMGIIKSSTTTKDGVRHSTARAFLSPIKDRKNLHIIKNTHATKILFKSGTNTVSGVLLRKDDKEINVNIKKELIVSGGSINSPQLLMLSGIGPRSHLESLGIEVKVDLPVGENLEDHLWVPIFYTAKDIENYTSLSAIFQVFAKYILERKGPLSDTSPHRVIAFVNTTDPNAISPDVQYHHIVFPPGVSNLLDMLEKHDLSDEVQQKFNELNKDTFTMILYTTLLKPKSKGKIILKSTDPLDHPLIYANYFKDPADMKTVLDGMKQHTLKLGDTETFQKTGFKLNFMELEACKPYETGSDDFLECLARELTFSLYHPTSTNKMGPKDDKSSVVDPDLKVKGINGLRVIDASIMPSIVRGNTNAPTIMIGEKGADIIKTSWLNKHTEL